MHFVVEEDYMLLFGFDGYQEHKNEHDKFLEKVEEFEAKLMQGELLLSYDVLSFLTLKKDTRTINGNALLLLIRQSVQ